MVVFVTKTRNVLFLSANMKFTESRPIRGELKEKSSEKTAETKVPDSHKTIVSHSDGLAFA